MFTLDNRRSFMFSAENLNGEPNGGTRGKDCEKLNPRIRLEPGTTAVLCDTDGPGMISSIWIGGHNGHSIILRMYWDNEEFPSVEVPMSAFFGNFYDENVKDRDGKFITLNSSKILFAPCRGFSCYWEMPFKKHCRITVENRGYETKPIYYAITGWHGEVPENSGYFHAQYRQEHPVEKGRSYVALDVAGRGMFAGIAMASGLNGNSTCWVEGEVKMYIDGDQYPRINYTGTEDYFCGSYAFGNDIDKEYQTYSGHYVGMYAILGDMRDYYNTQQRFMMYRWHEKDPIYFEKGFKMCMDNMGWTGPRYDDYTSVAFYYMDKPTQLTEELPEDNELVMK
ncbi:MAG: DUF2961 domain-containing protein [Clostridia bacterium]|nr:DUF2961 domain-containing protein [Clostridia bacterium]